MAFVKTEVYRPVEIITIHSPKALNASNHDVLADLNAAVGALAHSAFLFNF